ncbi:hypothetical protein BROUX41_000904 [Berkeleyomyces rouxiae]|uniref:uncharacterized protein n=1 Tax=Berkeleyomyces rouxiae TaxID=2035830 RepID=UPI003B7F1095
MSANNYLVFIRVPRPRADFVDPPPYEWDSAKDDALWNILTAKGGKADVGWNELAVQFNVTAEFLLRQVNYLNERHASHLKAEVRRATNALKSSPHVTAAATATPTIEPNSRDRSSTNIPSYVRDIPATPPFPGSGAASLTNRPPSLRNVAPTVYPSLRPDPAETHSPFDRLELRQRYSDLKDGGDKGLGYPSNDYRYDNTNNAYRDNDNRNAMNNNDKAHDDGGNGDDADYDHDNDHDDSSNASSSPAQSRIFRRPPLYGGDRAMHYADEEDSEPAFRIEQSSETSPAHSQTMTSTLRGETSGCRVSRTNTALSKHHQKHRYQISQTSDSSNNSSFITRMPGPSNEGGTTIRTDIKKAKKDTHHSPKNSKVSSKSSDIGSSFSDLDGESFSNSVSTSAMADALAGLDMSRLTLGSSINRFVNRRYGQ